MDDAIDIKLKLFQLPEIDNDILKSNFNICISTFQAQPLCSLGFNYYFHQSYDKFSDIVKNQKSDFFWIINNFEVFLTDPDNKLELVNKSEMYLKAKHKCFNSNIFYKFWDILTLLVILEDYSVNILVGNKSDIQTTLELFINNIVKLNKKQYRLDFVTTDYNCCIIDFDFDFNTKTAETDYFVDIIEHIVIGLDNLKNNGLLIVKIGDMYTQPTIKCLMLLNCIFKNVFVYKPYYSKAVDSEKYILCKQFNKQHYDIIAKKLKKSIDLMKEKKKSNYIIDFMSDIPSIKTLDLVITYINLLIGGTQHKEKNKIITYIESENYFGLEYQTFATKQLKSIEFFISNYYPITIDNFNEILKKNAKALNVNNNFIKMFLETKKIIY